MEKFIAERSLALKRGFISRRQFCETLAAATTVLAAGKSAASTAAPQRGFRIIGINHISYACPDYRKARDFYESVLGMQSVSGADNGRETRLMFGPAPGKGGTFFIPRNGRTVPKAKAVIDHIAYTMAGDKTRLRAMLAAKGVAPEERGESFHLRDAFDFDVQAEAAPSAAATASPQAALVHHISYSCPDFKRAADWYANIFNLEQVGTSASEVTLLFGPKDARPLGVTASDVPLPHLVMRNATPPKGEAPRAGKGLVNHIAYTIADFEKDRVRAELKRLGYAKPLQDGEHSFHIVDPNGFDVQISGIQMTALGG
jgi:catechol 2,3-dioxygenase-like lactoylglutathione lyase family enzyme